MYKVDKCNGQSQVHPCTNISFKIKVTFLGKEKKTIKALLLMRNIKLKREKVNKMKS